MNLIPIFPLFFHFKMYDLHFFYLYTSSHFTNILTRWLGVFSPQAICYQGLGIRLLVLGKINFNFFNFFTMQLSDSITFDTILYLI